MSDPLKELLAAGVLPKTTYPPTSRYSDTELASFEYSEDEPSIPYLARRFCPQPDRFSTLYNVRLVESDRRDTLATKHIGDPHLWWRIADANGVLDPRHLSSPAGNTVRVTLAIDIPGSVDD
jgi:hypothetical protein